MGDCCKRKLKCLEFVSDFPTEAEKKEWIKACDLSWYYWREVNRRSFELLAAVVSCAKATEIVDRECPLFLTDYGKYLGNDDLVGTCETECCQNAKKQLHLCKGNDPKAKIECCPFDKDGEPDKVCFDKLVEIYKKNKKP